MVFEMWKVSIQATSFAIFKHLLTFKKWSLIFPEILPFVIVFFSYGKEYRHVIN